MIEWFLNTIAQPFGLRKVNRVMAAMRDDARDVSLAQKAMDAFRIKVETDGSDISTIPATGGLLVVANHPLSGIEGFAIAAKLASVRPDVKIVANEVLKKVPGTEDMIIGVDVMNPESRENMKAYREMQKWVKEGHVLLIFPAGNVSRYQPETKIVADPPWSRSIAKIAKKNDAPVLPIFVHGQPGALFQTLDRVNPKLGSSAVPREMLRQDGTTVKLTIGTAIASEEVAKFEDDGDAVAFLRGKTYELGGITETPAK